MINDNIDWELVHKQYHEQGVSVIDDFISDTSIIDFLRDFPLIVPHRDMFYRGYSALDFNKSRLLPSKIEMLIDSVQRASSVLSSKQFSRGWFFIYDTESDGVGVHVDPHSDITLNIWVTPDECTEGGKGFNGLDIWRIEPKPEWDYQVSLYEHGKCMEYIHQEQAEMISVEYRFNRVVLFNSNYFHRSQPVKFKRGDENRKINYALLFSSDIGGL
jgi:hypothetical protein